MALSEAERFELEARSIPKGPAAATAAAPHRSSYDGRYYRDEIEAVQRMVEVETGEPTSRAAADVWIDREADARNVVAEWGFTR